VCRELLTTTAIILPLMSLTVPCNTNSGMERHFLPPVQLADGPELLTVRIGLINGSLRPFCPTGRGAGFFSATGGVASAILAGGFLLVTAAAGALGVVTAMTGALPLVFAGAGVGFGAAPFALITGTVPLVLGPGLLAGGNVPVATGSLLPLAPFLLAELTDAFLFPAAPGALLTPACAALAVAGCAAFFAVCGPLALVVCDAAFTGCVLVCDPALAACVPVPAGVDPAFTACPLGCDPVLVACAALPDAGCEPVLAAAAEDALPAGAGVGEGEVLAGCAGDFTGVAAAFAGVDDGLGFAACVPVPAGVDPAFPVCPLGCDPVLAACAPLPDAGCEPFLAAGDPLPAVAGVGEGDVLAWGAGDFTGVAPAFAGVDDGLGFACWLEFAAAPAFWAVAVAAKTIASATT
jgi:hypothetical protein